MCNSGYEDEGGTCVLPDPCADVVCEDPNAGCVVGTCECDDGYHDQSGTCVEDDACADVTCDDPNTYCDDGGCVCYQGYHDDNGSCVEDECCGNGYLNGEQDACECDSGFNDNDGDLRCGPDTPDNWPPDLDSLWTPA